MRYRIVSTSPDVTEILCALGLFEDVVGVSRFCDWPPEVKIIPKVSDFVKVDLRAVEEMHPDLVVTSTYVQKEIVQTLTARHIRVLALHPFDLQSIFTNIRLLGDLFGRQFEAGDLVSRMKREFMEIQQEASNFPRRPRVFCEEWGDPIIVGIGWIQEMIEIAGGISPYARMIPAADTSRRTITAAELRRTNPEIILLAWCGMKGKANPKILEGREGWREIDAVKNKRVFSVNDNLYVRAGPRLVEGAREILRYVGEFQ
jgi:iron complex transport system substrate-binding protein